jgi:Icc-related predicted phosphoesterase
MAGLQPRSLIQIAAEYAVWIILILINLHIFSGSMGLAKNISLILVLSLAAGLAGCTPHSIKSQQEINPVNLAMINGIDYKMSNDSITQLTADSDSTAKFGVISDTHGYWWYVDRFSRQFKSEGVDGILMLGDYAQNSRAKAIPFLSDYWEIYLCIGMAAKTGLPVYVLPGNHDYEADYSKVMQKLQAEYPNVIDMSRIRLVDGNDFDFVSNPYGESWPYVDGAFMRPVRDVESLVTYLPRLQPQGDPLILLSHEPPRSNSSSGVDFTFDGQDVGSVVLNSLMDNENIDFSLSGHIHEAGGRASTGTGAGVGEGVYSDELRFSPGAASPWEYLDGVKYKARAGIVTIDGNRMKYEMINLK